MLFEKLERHSSRIAVINGNDEALTFIDLIKMSKQIRSNIKKRSLIFLLGENSIESLAGYIAFVNSGCVIMLINSQIKDDDLYSLYNKYLPDFLWCNKKITLNFTGKYFSTIINIGQFQLLENNKKIKFSMDENLMLLLSTSGSLGDPKCVKLTYKNIKKNSSDIIDYLKIDSKDRTITTLPINYSYGLSIINTHLIAGASIILNKKTLIDKDFWKIFHKNKVNNFNGVPYTFEILRKIGYSKLFLNKIKYITQAGGKMNENIICEIYEKSIKSGAKFYIMYGQTEASPRMSYINVNEHPDKIRSIGKSIQGGMFSLQDNKGNEIKKNDETGELIYHGENVFMGYSFNFHDLNKKNEIKNKLQTGDLAKRDSDGYYYIVGRKKRFIKLYGDRINLDYLEIKLKSKNLEAACVGNDDQLIIFCVAEKKKKVSKHNISKTINIPESRFKLIELENLPLNENKKISYAKLNKMAQQ